ncbi:MAG: phosphotransferase enzyme domain protein, partial [Spirochaetia bacterium]|nr:phosphotransferase enzyme domain protein [Spirochaetia bacterium]
MIQSIGIDFDNTIANYDSVFTFIGKEKNIISDDWSGNKKELRNLIRSRENGDIEWQKIQGKVYGKFMHKAELFHGFSEFLILCRLRNIKIYIVSHKTEYGHFDE